MAKGIENRARSPPAVFDFATSQIQKHGGTKMYYDLVVMDSDIPNDDSVDPNTISSASVIVAILPFAVIYPFCQKYFVQGVNIGAVKE